LIGAICASPAVVLEYHGLLQGEKATCYPALEAKIKDKLVRGKDVVISNKIITSRGPGTSIIFSLTLVDCIEQRKEYLNRL